MIVYKITNKLNGKIYIGQTIRSLKDRWNQHNWTHSQCRILHNAIKKYGKETFSIEELGSYSNFEDLNNAEEYFIDWYNCITPNGYNATGVTEGSRSLETREKQSKSMMGNRNGKGVKRTEAFKRNLSILRLGNKHACGPKSEEHANKLREHLKRLAMIGANNKNKTRDSSGKFKKSE